MRTFLSYILILWAACGWCWRCFQCHCLTGLEVISCDSVTLLFWSCHYFLEQAFCIAANMPWVLLLHIAVILLCQGRIQPRRARVSLLTSCHSTACSNLGETQGLRGIFLLLPHKHGTGTLLGNRMLYMCVYLSLFMNIFLVPLVIQL